MKFVILLLDALLSHRGCLFYKSSLQHLEENTQRMQNNLQC